MTQPLAFHELSNVQNPVDIPLNWLVDRDPYNGLLLYSLYNWVVFHPLYNPTNRGPLEHCSTFIPDRSTRQAQIFPAALDLLLKDTAETLTVSPDQLQVPVKHVKKTM